MSSGLTSRTANWRIILASAMISFWSPAIAQVRDDPLNPLDCLYAVQDLTFGFRAHLEMMCLDLPSKECLRQEDPEQCFAALNLVLRDHFDEVRPLLPDTLDGGGISASSYQRALLRFESDFSDPTGCGSLGSIDEDNQLQFCTYIQFAVGTVGLMYRARQAGVTRP
mgnify:CR=1 FL=1